MYRSRRLWGAVLGTLALLALSASLTPFSLLAPHSRPRNGGGAPPEPAGETASLAVRSAWTAAIHPLSGYREDGGFTDLYFLSPSVGLLSGQSCIPGTVGQCEAFLEITRDGGRHFRSVLRGGNSISGITFTGNDAGWALEWTGAYCHVAAATCRDALLATRDGGEIWRPVYRLPPGVPTDPVFESAAVGWIGVSTCHGRSTSCNGTILGTADGGRSWHREASLAGRVLRLAAFGGGAWAVVSDSEPGIAARILLKAGPERAWRTVGNVPSGSRIPLAADSAELLIRSPGDAWLSLFSMQTCAMHGCGLASVYRSTDGGRHWTQADVPGGCTVGLPEIALTAHGVLSAEASNTAACRPPAGTLSAAASDGRFRQVYAWDLSGVGQIDMLPGSDVGFALVGGSLQGTADGGSTWTRVFPAVVPQRAIDFVDRRTGFGVGAPADPGAVLRTDDGGSSWRVLASFPMTRLAAIAFADPRHGLLAVERLPSQRWELLATSDGGSTWQDLGPSPPVMALGLWSPRHGFEVTTACSDAWNGAGGCAPATVRTTDDGGVHWHTEQAVPARPLLVAVDSPAPGSYYAVEFRGAGTAILNASHASAGWSPVGWLPKAYDGTFGAVDAPRQGTIWILRSATYRRSDKTFTAPGGYSYTLPYAWKPMLLRSTSGGGTWSRIDFPRTMSHPIAADFLSAKVGFLLTDAFPVALWRTTDGGRSWRQVR